MRKNFFSIALSMTIIFFLFCQNSAKGQGPQKIPAKPIICPAKFEDMHTRVNIADNTEAFHLRTISNATAQISVTYGPGAEANPEAKAAFQFALDIWSNQIVSPVPIKVYADFATLGAGVLASAGPAYFVNEVPNAPDPNILYPAALANAIAGETLFPDEEYDLIVNLGNGIPWYFGTDGNTPSGLYDFVTVALHEAGHGLGFTAIRNYDADTGIGSLRSGGFPSIYGIYIIDGDGNYLIDFSDPSIEIGDAFTSGNIFIGSTFAKAALGGTPPELYAPSTFQGGSSIAHWDEVAFPAGDPNSLMSPQVGSAEANHDIGDITRGLFKDMGWVINNAQSSILVVSPNSVSDEFFVGEGSTYTFEVSNVSDEEITANISTNENSATITSFNPSNLLIPSGGTVSFEMTVSTAGLSKGIYEDEIIIQVQGTEDIKSIPVTIRVIDGTETPIISVSPQSFNETTEQYQVITRALTIDNSGDGDLSYSISIDGTPISSLTSLIATSKNSIKAQGFKKEKVSNSLETSSKQSLLRNDTNTYNKITTSLYATDFEEFSIGDINTQLGWEGRYTDNWIISDANPFEGAQHFRGISDGLGGTRAASVLAFSPTITPGSEPFMVLSASVNIQGSGVSWEIIPQSPTAGSVNTRLRFNTDGTIDVLAGAGFTRIDATIPTGYFDLKLIFDKDDSSFRVYFDDELIFSGIGFAPEIEQVVFLSGMEVVGSTIDIDNLEITDGDPNAFFLTVSPSSGIVPFGSSSVVNLKFDSRILEPGEYSASLNISSDDATNPLINIPVSLTVLAPPTIEVTPNSLSASVNVQTDIPPTKTESFIISNTGESTLDFTSSLGSTQFTPITSLNALSVGSIDMTLYGKGNTGIFKEKSAKIPKELVKTKSDFYKYDAVTFSDSIYYDSGIPFPDDFSGLQTSAYTSAIKFDVDNDFTLTAVRNGYITDAVANPIIIVEIYKGGTTPDAGELLLTQTFNEAGPDGIVVVEVLNQSLSFSAGESFWVVHKYPDGIAYPQGIDSNATQRPDTYMYSSDGGTSYSPSGFVFFVRALSGGGDGASYLTLEPSSGSIAPGQSLTISATFDGTGIANGTYDTDIRLSSNDPLTPIETVTTSFEVSGQVSEISVSEDFLLFNNVFIGAEKELTFTINNTGLSQLNVSSISSDNPDFSVDTSTATIAAEESLEVTVTFTPSTLGSINGVISIESDADNIDLLEIVVNGVGVEPPIAVVDPQEVFLTTDAGTTIDSQITLKNEGNSPLLFSFPDLAVAAALSKPDVKLNNTEHIDFKNFSNKQAKGYKDNRIGAPILYNIGTDNGFGYSWIDSDETGGPVYSFNDITATGTEITDLMAGDGTTELPITFPFEFYGVTNSSVYVNANGFLAFQLPTSSTWVNSQIPDSDGINNIIAGLWTDLEPQEFNGAVHFQDFGDRLIVQWTQATLYDGSSEEYVTFQIVLYDNGNIDVFYDDVETASFINSVTVGIENADASDGAQVAFNTSYIKNGLALRFIKPAISLTPLISNVSPISGVVGAGSSKSLTVTLDATNLNDGVYYDELVVSSNDPVDTANTALFELTVVGHPEIEITPETLSFDPLFIGLSSEASFMIKNIGSKELQVLNISNNNNNFVLDNLGPITLDPGMSQIIAVEFTPTTIGSIEDEITIVSNDTFGNESIIVTLSGEGVDPPVIETLPDSFTLSVMEGKSVTENVSISNTGGSTLNYSFSPPLFAKAGEANQTIKGYDQIEYAKIESKETLDTRVGPKFLNASGGPDTFGYTWVDNNSGGPAYDFIDISATGQLANTGGDGSVTVPLPFDFNFFGNIENNVTIAANGYLTFAPITGLDYTNQQIPNENTPNLFIAPMWTDIEPQNGDGIFYLGTEDYFIVQYENVPGFGFPPLLPIPDPVSFQVILFSDGSIKMQYKNVDSSLRTSSTVGLEGPQGLSGLQVIFNTEYLTDELAITFIPPLSGTVEPGETIEIPVTFSAEELEAGQTYFGDITINSNDILTPVVSIPVSMEVVKGPEVVSLTLIDAFSNTEIGLLNDGDLIELDDFIENSFSVVANVGDVNVGSVVFDLNKTKGYKTENIAPFALNGDFSDGTNFYPVEFPIGINTITATPYSGRNGTGEKGTSLTISFEVIRTTTFEIVSFTLINTDTNVEIGTLNEGDVINLNDYNRNSFSVVANIGTLPVGSVIFDFNDYENYKIENIAPYSLKGDYTRNGNIMQYPVEFRLGMNTITATPYSDKNGGGEIGNALSVNFEVIDSNDSCDEIKVSVYPNSVVDIAHLSIKSQESSLNATMYNLYGRLVYKSVITLRNNQSEGTIDMSHLHQGIYILQLTNKKGEILSQLKIVKE